MMFLRANENLLENDVDHSHGVGGTGRKPLGNITNQQTKKVKLLRRTKTRQTTIPYQKSKKTQLHSEKLTGERKSYSNKKRGLSSPKKPSFVDIDSPYHKSSRHCTAYVETIMINLKKAEFRRRPVYTDYLLKVQHNDVTEHMRAVLLDWVVDVIDEFQFSQQTLFLTTNYIERYLSLKKIAVTRLQLLAIAAMFVASKFEEVEPAAVSDFLDVADNTYTETDLLEMEFSLLNALKFELSAATPRDFIRRYQKAAATGLHPGVIPRAVFLSDYLCELTVLDYQSVQYSKDVIAASAIFLSLLTLKQVTWSSTLEHYTGYKLSNPTFQQCIRRMTTLYKEDYLGVRDLSAVRSRYLKESVLHVAGIAPPC